MTRSGKPTGSAAAGEVAPEVDDGPGQDRDAGAGDHLLGARLVAHDAHGLGRRAHPHHAGVPAGLGQVGALREEPVAGVERVGAGLLCRRHEGRRVEVGRGETGTGSAQRHRRVGLTHVRAPRVVGRVHGHGLAAGVVRAADDAAGDFAAVGHEHPAQRPGRGGRRGRPGRTRGHQCLTTPKTAVPRTGAECTAVSATARTVRVSRGSMMPSSHSRPVAYCAVDSSSI